MKTSTKLRKARALIETGWCKGAFARTKSGRATKSRDSKAARWCAMGACRRVGLDTFSLSRALSLVDAGGGLAAFNDSQTNKRPVLKLFNDAIELAEASEARC